MRIHKTAREVVNNPHLKAKPAGAGEPHTELDETTGVRDIDGYNKPSEEDNSNFRAELETDWIG